MNNTSNSNLLAVRNIKPTLGKENWIAPNATIAGDTILGDYCTVWFNATIRGDVAPIRIGHYTNIQDNVLLHAMYMQSELHIGNYVSVGHGVSLHGCTVHDYSLIGMHTIVLDHAVIPEYCLIGAASLVKASDKLESHTVYAGNPLRKIRKLKPSDHKLLSQTPLNYVKYASWY